MCWFSKKKPIKKVADTDIPVKKVLFTFNDITSPLHNCKWVVGEVNECEMEEPKINIYGLTGYHIDKGFHSCENIVFDKNANIWRNGEYDALFLHGFGEVVYDAIIPAGSEYYRNDRGDYVSNRLKIIG